MVAVDVCRQDIVCSGGIDVCLELLSESPLDYKTPAEMAACERVQQKAAIALTRMCRDENNAVTIVKAEGRAYRNFICFKACDVKIAEEILSIIIMLVAICYRNDINN
jgi:hypothetical protein